MSRPRLSLPKRLLRHRSGQSQQQGPEEAVDDNADAATSPFQAAAQPGQEPLGRVRVQVYAGRDILAVGFDCDPLRTLSRVRLIWDDTRLGLLVDECSE